MGHRQPSDRRRVVVDARRYGAVGSSSNGFSKCTWAIGLEGDGSGNEDEDVAGGLEDAVDDDKGVNGDAIRLEWAGLRRPDGGGARVLSSNEFEIAGRGGDVCSAAVEIGRMMRAER